MKAIQASHALKCGGKHFRAGETLLVGKGKDVSTKDAKYLVASGAAYEVVAPSNDVSVDELLLVEDLSTLSVAQLKRMCKELNLTPYANKKEAELVAMLEEYRGDDVVNVDAMSEEELLALADEEGVVVGEYADIEELRKIIVEALG
jgi:hypothetical protein